MFISNPNICNGFSGLRCTGWTPWIEGSCEGSRATLSHPKKWPAKEPGIRVFSSLPFKIFAPRLLSVLSPSKLVILNLRPQTSWLDLFTCLGAAMKGELLALFWWASEHDNNIRDSTQQWIQWQCPRPNHFSYIYSFIIFEHDIPTGECEVLGKEMTSI